MPGDALGPTDLRILAALGEHAGTATRDVVLAVEGASRSRRQRISLMARRLAFLERAGYVRRLDDERPIAWCRTRKGTEGVGNG